jgi:hypothetical protein
MDFIHPETVVVDDGNSGGAPDNNWQIVGARRYAAGCGGEEEAAVDANRRKNIGQAKNTAFTFWSRDRAVQTHRTFLLFQQDMPRSTSAACETGNGEEPNMYTRKPGITLK